MKFKNLVGKRFGSRVVISASGPVFGATGLLRGYGWNCICDCGIKSVITTSCLNLGTSNSCGCGRVKSLTTHGGSYSPEYKVWGEMKGRCSRRNHKAYHRYGGRGIKVCSRWNSFKNFLKDMGRRPTDEHSIERKNNDGDYCPSNCCWATASDQNSNTSRSRKLKLGGKIKTLSQWAKEIGICPESLAGRLSRGWSIKNALTKPKGYLP